jgi:hypothetical protein
MRKYGAIFGMVLLIAPVSVATQNQPSSNAHRQNAEHANPATPVSVNCNCQTQADNSKNNPPGWHKFVTWPEGIATWALIFTLAAIAWQAVETRRSVEATANAQRSWLLVTSVENPDLQQVWINKAIVHLKVVGSSPLRALEAKLVYAVLSSRPYGAPEGFYKQPDLPEQPNYGEPLDLTDTPSMGKVHAPGDEMRIEITLEDMFLTADHAKALKQGQSFLCVYGFIRYRDSSVSWKRRETRFCLACGNWGPTGKRITNGYFVAGPTEYNEVMEFPWWRQLSDKARQLYRKTKDIQQRPEKAN